MDEGQSSAFARWSPLAGLLFVAGVISLLLNPALDAGGDDPAALIANATEHAGWIEWNVIVGVVSVALLAVFVAGVAALTRRERGFGNLLVIVAGSVMTMLFTLAILLWSAPLLELPNDPAALQRSQAEVYFALEDIGWVAFVGSGVAAAAMIAGASLAAWKSGLLGGRAAAASLVLGLLAGIGTAAFVGLFVWLLWMVLASGFLLVRERRPAADAGAAAPAS